MKNLVLELKRKRFRGLLWKGGVGSMHSNGFLMHREALNGYNFEQVRQYYISKNLNEKLLGEFSEEVGVGVIV